MTRVDLRADYWRVKAAPAVVVHVNGGRLHFDHWVKVQRARLTRDTVVAGKTRVVGENA